VAATAARTSSTVLAAEAPALALVGPSAVVEVVASRAMEHGVLVLGATSVMVVVASRSSISVPVGPIFQGSSIRHSRSARSARSISYKKFSA
jgi:hypothetical protein